MSAGVRLPSGLRSLVLPAFFSQAWNRTTTYIVDHIITTINNTSDSVVFLPCPTFQGPTISRSPTRNLILINLYGKAKVDVRRDHLQ